MKLMALGVLALAVAACEERSAPDPATDTQLENQAGQAPGTATGAPATGSQPGGDAGAFGSTSEGQQADMCAQLAACYRQVAQDVCGDDQSCTKTFAADNVPDDDTTCRVQLLQVRRLVQDFRPQATDLPEPCTAAPQTGMGPRSGDAQRAGGRGASGGQVPGPAGAGPQGTGDFEQTTSPVNEKPQQAPDQ